MGAHHEYGIFRAAAEIQAIHVSRLPPDERARLEREDRAGRAELEALKKANTTRRVSMHGRQSTGVPERGAP